MEPNPNASAVIELTTKLSHLRWKLAENPQLVNNRNRYKYLPSEQVLEIKNEIKRIKANLVLLGVDPNG